MNFSIIKKMPWSGYWMVLIMFSAFPVLWIISKKKMTKPYILDQDMGYYTDLGSNLGVLDFGKFSLTVPSGYKLLKYTKPYDGKLNAITNGEDTIFVEQSWYAKDLRKDYGKISKDTINGQIGYLRQTDTYIKLGFYDYASDERLLFVSKAPDDRGAVLQILKTVKFKNQNSKAQSQNFGKNWINGNEGNWGYVLYENNCASCHNFNGESSGPSLRGVFKRRKREWLLSWLKDPLKLVRSKDSEALALVKKYADMGIMPPFSCLKRAELEAILDYVSTFE